MSKIKGSIIGLYIIIILYLVIFNMYIIPNYPNRYTLINIIVWFCIFALSIVLTHGDRNVYKKSKDKIKIVFIITVIYLIVYFLLGLILGYLKSPYAHTFIGIFKNIFNIIVIIIFQEYVRAKLINYDSKKVYIYILITVMFIIVNIEYSAFMNSFSDAENMFKYVSSILFPTILKGCLFTYLSSIGGYILTLTYRIPIILVIILVPLFPDLDWFFIAIMECTTPFIIFLFVNYEYIMKESRLSKREISKQTPLVNMLLIVILLVFVGFVAGVFKYKPLAIMSNSMIPNFGRGDIVISKKLNKGDIENIQIGDIVEYTTEKYTIIHRVINIYINKAGENIYITKGDNNNAPDAEIVESYQIVGVIKLSIPKLGYPSVWFSNIIRLAK
ncbi:MAG: signal peptidase I [Clostridia bacterium]|nr:signal peptidase I [Clostridia bacterium]MDD4387223.1 signal peptidase I [Clostridia bacterium]